MYVCMRNNPSINVLTRLWRPGLFIMDSDSLAINKYFHSRKYTENVKGFSVIAWFEMKTRMTVDRNSQLQTLSASLALKNLVILVSVICCIK